MKETIENAKITNIFFGIEDHGCMTLTINLEGAGWGCGFGGYNLLGEHGMKAIKQLLETFEMNDLYGLKGKYVRVEFESSSGCSGIKRIGDIISDKWFSFKEFYENVNKE